MNRTLSTGRVLRDRLAGALEGRDWRRSQLAFALPAMLALVAAGLGDGYSTRKVELSGGGVWLASSSVGQLTLVDGSSAQVVAQVVVSGQRASLQAAQTGAAAYALDRRRGTVVRVDATTYEPGKAVQVVRSGGAQKQAFVGRDALYVLDAEHAEAALVDPRTLSVPERHRLSTTVRGGGAVVDRDGRLWLLDRADNEVVSLDGKAKRTRAAGTDLRDASLTLVDGHPALVSRADKKVYLIGKGGEPGQSVCLDMGPDVEAAIVGASTRRQAYAADGSAGQLVISDFDSGDCSRSVPLGVTGSRFGPPVEQGGRVFVPDYTTGQVHVVDLAGRRVIAHPKVLRSGGPFELFARDGFVFYNDPASEQAGVISLTGGIQQVQKYDPDNPGKGVGTSAPGKLPSPTDRQPRPTDRQPSPTTGPVDNTQPSPTADPQGNGKAPAKVCPMDVNGSDPSPAVGDSVSYTVSHRASQVVAPSWDFRDGTPVLHGGKVLQTWRKAGTFAGLVRATVNGSPLECDLNVTVTEAGGPDPVPEPTRSGVTPTASPEPSLSRSPTSSPSSPLSPSTPPPDPRGQDVTLRVQVAAHASVTLSPQGRGDPAVCNAEQTCSWTYTRGASVTVRATTVTGFHVSGWTGPCNSPPTGLDTADSTCPVVLEETKEIGVQTAADAPTPATLTVTPPSGGTVTGDGIRCGSECRKDYPTPSSGITNPLAATPNSGFRFVGWGDACIGSGSTPLCTVTMDTSKSVSATFVPLEDFQLTVSKIGSGTVKVDGVDCSNVCSPSYREASPPKQVTLTATANQGWRFGGWGACAGTGSCLVTMSGNRTVSATFVALVRTLITDSQFTVKESNSDVDTGIDIRPGDEITFDATGLIWAGVAFTGKNGPAGWDNLDNDPKFPLPGSHPYALLGKLGSYFYIGTGTDRVQPTSGGIERLFLRINDDTPDNGNGQFECSVRVWRLQ